MKMNLICMKMNLQVEGFLYEWFPTKTRFDIEAKDNSEIANCSPTGNIAT